MGLGIPLTAYALRIAYRHVGLVAPAAELALIAIVVLVRSRRAIRWLVRLVCVVIFIASSQLADAFLDGVGYDGTTPRRIVAGVIVAAAGVCFVVFGLDITRGKDDQAPREPPQPRS